MVEGTTIRGALGRSRQLVSGTFWRVWGIRALGWLVLQVVASLISLPFLALAFLAGGGLDALVDPTGTPIVFLLVVGLGSLIGATLTAPVRAGVDALLYVDLRMRKEGLDLVLQAHTNPVAAPPPMTAW
jgi:ABC-type amino acid transport system permease subunit